VKDDLLGEIRRGRWAIGDCLPRELDLSRQYNVSRFTVRQALLELTREGLLYRRAGKGTFIKSNVPVRDSADKRKKQIGFVLPYIADAHTGRILKGAEREAAENGYRIIFVNSQKAADEWSLLDELYHEGVAGIIYYYLDPAGCEENVIKLRERDFPFVLVDRFLPHIPTDYVVSDNFTGSYEAVRHLLTLGHRRIGMIACDRRVSSVEQRLKGYCLAIKNQGLDIDLDLLLLEDERELAEPKLTAFMEKTNLTAIFTSDFIAIGAMKLAARLGKKVPEELAVVGFDNAPVGNFTIPSLTTVEQPCEQLGAEAVKILINKFKGTELLTQKVLNTELIVRASSGEAVAIKKTEFNPIFMR
jgi:DNA-binding LacI/PurR family transcriptional regulator